jgi:hypothetical protein
MEEFQILEFLWAEMAHCAPAEVFKAQYVPALFAVVHLYCAVIIRITTIMSLYRIKPLDFITEMQLITSKMNQQIHN